MKSVKAWAIYNGGGHLLAWTVRGTRREAIGDHIKTFGGSPNRSTWKDLRHDLGSTCRRVIVQEK